MTITPTGRPPRRHSYWVGWYGPDRWAHLTWFAGIQAHLPTFRRFSASRVGQSCSGQIGVETMHGSPGQRSPSAW